MIQKYKKVSNEYQKAVKSFNIEQEKSFLQNNIAKINWKNHNLNESDVI